MAWPVSSPHLNPVDIFMWRQCKSPIYTTELESQDASMQKLHDALQVMCETPEILE
jgi:hypothetical protein